jgi:hypothetical protein
MLPISTSFSLPKHAAIHITTLFSNKRFLSDYSVSPLNRFRRQTVTASKRKIEDSSAVHYIRSFVFDAFC